MYLGKYINILTDFYHCSTVVGGLKGRYNIIIYKLITKNLLGVKLVYVHYTCINHPKKQCFHLR